MVLPGQVGDQLDVRHHQLVLQQEVLQQPLRLRQRGGLRTQRAEQRLGPGARVGPGRRTPGRLILLLREAQSLQDAVLMAGWGDTLVLLYNPDPHQ